MVTEQLPGLQALPRNLVRRLAIFCEPIAPFNIGCALIAGQHPGNQNTLTTV